MRSRKLPEPNSKDVMRDINNDVLGLIIPYLDHEGMSKFVQAIKGSLDAPNPNGRYISGRNAYNTIKKRRDLSFKLIRAVKYYSLRTVRQLLSKGADPNLAVPGYSTPLVYIARSATYLHYPIIQLLLERGADPLRADPLQPEPTEENTEQTALSLARNNNTEIYAQMLHSAAARPERQHLLPPEWNSPLVRNVVDDDDASLVTGLVDAATDDQIELSFMLAVLKDNGIKLFALVNTLTPEAQGDLVRETARFAARLGQNSIVLSLVGDPTVDRDELIWDAARTDNLLLLPLLLEGYSADSPMRIEVFNRAMWLAMYCDNSAVVQALLDKCVDIQPPLLPQEAHSEITWPDIVVAAARNGHHEVLELLLTRVPEEFNFGEALSFAAYAGHLDVLELLLTRVPQDFNLLDVLGIAARNGHLDIVTSLLKKGALRDDSGDIHLRLAVEGGHSKVVDELLAYGAYPEGLGVALSRILMGCTFLLLAIAVIGCMINPSLFFAVFGITVIKAACYNFLITFLIHFFLIIVMGAIFSNYLDSRSEVGVLFSAIFSVVLFFSSALIPPLLFLPTAIITGPAADLLFVLPIALVSASIGVSACNYVISVIGFILACRRSSLSLHRTLLAACGFYKTKSPDEVPDSDHAAQPVPSV